MLARYVVFLFLLNKSNFSVDFYFCQGARMVRELFEMARTKKACIIFFDEIDAIGGARFDDGAGGDNEVQRTMLELINQLDGFDPRGNIKVLMATNRPDTLDPALMRPGRLDRKVEFSLPDLEVDCHCYPCYYFISFYALLVTGPSAHLQNPRKINECRKRHSL
jgi:ATP-dependent 26S proteasome regulatory subunit